MEKNDKKSRLPLEAYIVGLLCIVASVIMLAQVIGRYVFGNSLSWSEELVRFIFIWATMVGAAYATREGANISVDAFEQILKPKACFIYKNIGNAIFLASVLYLVYQSALYLRFTISTHAMATVTKLPLAYVYASLPVGFGLVALRLCINWYKLIREFVAPSADGEVEE